MEKFVSLFFSIWLWPALTLAQSNLEFEYNPDSLRTYQLKEVVVSNETIDGVSNKGKSITTDNVDDFIKKLSGVDVINRGAYAAEPVYRGMSGDRAPVTINNMKIFGACTDKMDPVSSYVSTNNLKSIAVVKDASSHEAMNSTAGVIAFKTKSPVFNGVRAWQGQVGGGFKSVNNEYNGQFSTAYSRNSMAFRANGTYRKAGNYVAGGGEEVEFSQYEKTNLAISGSYLANENTIINGEYIFDLAQNVGYPALPMDVSTARGNIYSLSVNKYIGNNQVEAKIYGNNIFHDMDDSQRIVVMHMDMPGWSNTYGSFINWQKESEGNTWAASVDYYLNQSRAEMTMYPTGEIPMYMLTWPDVQKNSVSLSLSNDKQITEKLSLSTSARLEVGTNEIKDEFGVKQLQAIGILGVTGNTFLLPSISAKLVSEVGSKTKLNLVASYGQRQASVTEGFGYYIYNSQDNFDYVGDPRLTPETAIKLETGVSVENKALAWNLQAFGYYMPNYIIGEYRPEYSQMTIGATGVKFYVNLPSATLVGFEGGLGWQLAQEVNLATQVQYTFGVDSENEFLPMIPPLKKTLRISYDNEQWVGGVEVRSAMAQNNIREIYGETATPGYSILNFDAGYNFKLDKTMLRLGVQAKNLLDQYYWDHMDFNTIPSPGRSINISVMMSWE